MGHLLLVLPALNLSILGNCVTMQWSFWDWIGSWGFWRLRVLDYGLTVLTNLSCDVGSWLLKSINIACVDVVRPSATRQRPQLDQCVVICSKIFYFIKIFYCPIERGLTVPNWCFYPILDRSQGRAVLYDNIVYQNNTISPSVFPPPPLPSEKVGGMNTKLFSEVIIF